MPRMHHHVVCWFALLMSLTACVHPQESPEQLAARPAFSGCRALAPEAPSFGWQACWRGSELTITNSRVSESKKIILADELVRLMARHRQFTADNAVAHMTVTLAAPVLTPTLADGQPEPHLEVHVQLQGRGEALFGSYPTEPAHWPLQIEDLLVRGAVRDMTPPYQAKTVSVLFHDGIERAEKEAVLTRAGLAIKNSIPTKESMGADLAGNPLTVAAPLLGEQQTARSLGQKYAAWVAAAGVVSSPDAEQFRLAVFSE